MSEVLCFMTIFNSEINLLITFEMQYCQLTFRYCPFSYMHMYYMPLEKQSVI